uniref:Uncharacterized protein n=1 Tax=Sphaerodactylus townsendi TaxID=933632 RepID=A0ACB8EYT7_9SAUR
MNLGSASQFIVDFPAPVNHTQAHELGPVDSKGNERSQDTIGPGPSKTDGANPCMVRRGLWLLAIFGLLVGITVGVWFLVKQLLRPPPLPETPPCQDTEALLTRLTHHKGVNLTDVEVDSAQAFVQLVPNWKGNVEERIQIRHRCPSGRIVALKCLECGTLSKEHGGSPMGYWPWQVSLHLSSKHTCAGSVLSHQWIVTAAHCMRKQANGGVTVTRTEVQEEVAPAVEKILVHPHYGAQSRDYDIAMLKLKEPLTFSEMTQAICLPRYHQTTPSGSKCWIPRWDFEGQESAEAAEVPKGVPATLIGMQQCNGSCGHAGELTARMLCADYLDSSSDACQE